jgi:hypothetical protein
VIGASIGTLPVFYRPKGKPKISSAIAGSWYQRRRRILAVISVAFFFALGIIAFSNRTDARRVAVDMIKTILGVCAGMATKLVD